jgi:hypothetical protein
VPETSRTCCGWVDVQREIDATATVTNDSWGLVVSQECNTISEALGAVWNSHPWLLGVVDASGTDLRRRVSVSVRNAVKGVMASAGLRGRASVSVRNTAEGAMATIQWYFYQVKVYVIPHSTLVIRCRQISGPLTAAWKNGRKLRTCRIVQLSNRAQSARVRSSWPVVRWYEWLGGRGCSLDCLGRVVHQSTGLRSVRTVQIRVAGRASLSRERPAWSQGQ